MTRKEMADQVSGWLGLQDIAVLDESQAVLNQIYWGTIDVLARTKCVARSYSLAVTSGVDTYTLDHSVLAIIDFQDFRQRARREQLPTAADIAADPTLEATLTPSYSLIRADLLRISPVPTANGTLALWVVNRPTKMVNDTDSVGDETHGAIPDEYQDAIVTYALWKLGDYADDSGSGQGQTYRVLYEGQDGKGGRLAEIRSLVNGRAPQLAGRKVRLRRPLSRRAWVG